MAFKKQRNLDKNKLYKLLLLVGIAVLFAIFLSKVIIVLFLMFVGGLITYLYLKNPKFQKAIKKRGKKILSKISWYLEDILSEKLKKGK